MNAEKWHLFQENKARQIFSKFDTHQQRAYEKIISKIEKNPYLGHKKKGDLKGVFEYKFSYSGATHSIAYLIDIIQRKITFIYYGPQENFYKRLKMWFKSKG